MDKGGVVSPTVPISSLVLVVRDDGDFPSPLETFPLSLLWIGLNFVLRICPVVGVSCEKNKDYTVALLTAIEEDHTRVVKGACSNPRGRRELLNQECSINYDTAGTSSRLWERRGSRFLELSALCGFWV
jgi:hypothetical protein